MDRLKKQIPTVHDEFVWWSQEKNKTTLISNLLHFSELGSLDRPGSSPPGKFFPVAAVTEYLLSLENLFQQ